MKKIKNPGFKIIFVVYVLLFLADMILSMYGGFAELLEVNPLYSPTYGFTLIIGINLIMIAAFYYFYHHKLSSNTSRFMFINIMIVVGIARCFAIKDHIHLLTDTVYTQQVLAAVANPAIRDIAINTTLKFYAWIQYLPIFASLITFLFWKIDHTIRRKDIKCKKIKQ